MNDHAKCLQKANLWTNLMSLKENLVEMIHKNWYAVKMSKSKFTVTRSQNGHVCLPE